MRDKIHATKKNNKVSCTPFYVQLPDIPAAVDVLTVTSYSAPDWSPEITA